MVTVTAVGAPSPGPAGIAIDFNPALVHAHAFREGVASFGTGIDIAEPLKFNHAANLPFANRGTGITFQPATALAHHSNEPVQPIGTGIALDSPLAKDHAIDAVVRDAAVTTAGYQGTPSPNQWFGGPTLSTTAYTFGDRVVTLNEGNMVLRDASGLVVDSLNYGLVVDPWAAKGYQGVSGADKGGCFVVAPGPTGGSGPFGPPPIPSDTSAGRITDGIDTDSNCADFVTEPATAMAAASAAGTTNLKVVNVAGFSAGQSIRIDTGANLETGVIASVGTAGATKVSTATSAGATVLPVASAAGFNPGQTITIGAGADYETAVVASTSRFGGISVTVSAPLTNVHAAGAQFSGTGITLTAALAREHASAAQVAGNASTPGAPNKYNK
jgi:hypothetical protein